MRFVCVCLCISTKNHIIFGLSNEIIEILLISRAVFKVHLKISSRKCHVTRLKIPRNFFSKTNNFAEECIHFKKAKKFWIVKFLEFLAKGNLCLKFFRIPKFRLIIYRRKVVILPKYVSIQITENSKKFEKFSMKTYPYAKLEA